MNMRAVTVVIAVVALSIAALAQGPRRDGQWEVKTEMEMAGMPAGMPPMTSTSTQCITPAEANDPQKSVPQMGRGRGRAGRGGEDDCKVSDYKMEGNKATWTMKCESGMTGTGEFVYAADSYTGVIAMETGRGAMKMKYTGKRIGDCVK